MSGPAPVLLGRGAAFARPVGTVGRAALAMDQRIPAPPERTHLQFVLARRLVLRHAARDVGPWQLALGREPALAAFEARYVVRRPEPGRPEERDKIFVRLLGQFRAVCGRP